MWPHRKKHDEGAEKADKKHSKKSPRDTTGLLSTPATPFDDLSSASTASSARSRRTAGGPAKGASMTMRSSKCPSSSLALTNFVFVHPDDAKQLSPPTGSVETPFADYLLLKDYVYSFKASADVPQGTVAMSSVQRRTAMVSLNEELSISTFIPNTSNIYLESIKFEVDFLSKQSKAQTFENAKLEEILRREFLYQFFTVDQLLVADVSGVTLKFQVSDLNVVDLASFEEAEGGADTPAEAKTKARRGIMMKKTAVFCVKSANSLLKVTGGEGMGGGGGVQFRHDWNFEQMGIGGLDVEFSDIFRRAFASRVLSPSFIQKLGIKHVKGVLLYGPPGTGKTLMARQIGKMLNGKEPKIVNGPEILNKYVGQSEENIRNLFKEAEDEYREKGEDSDLHIIIFDEIDAICGSRGTRSGSTGVADTVVNQLLSKIDGVESLNNILVIGMTNRKDMIDEALLRPGRLEVHMEIGLPDAKGRLQILRIHTARMRDNHFMSGDVDLSDLAERTKNFSGAEIEGLVKSATSFAFDRQIDATNPTKAIDPSKIQISKTDFDSALREVKPAFGVSSNQFANVAPNGIIKFSDSFRRIKHTGKLLTQQVANSSRTPLVSILLEGSAGSGKTALACALATKSEFPYVKLISPEDLVGYNEQGKCTKITKYFEDAYKSPLSVIVVDDLERLLDYVAIGPRFSNAVLQTLLVLLKKPPPKGRKLLLLATTSSRDVLEAMGFMDVFAQVLRVPDVSGGREVSTVLADLDCFSDEELETVAKQFNGSVPVKKLLMIAEMARQGDEGTLLERFFSCMQDAGVGSFSTK